MFYKNNHRLATAAAGAASDNALGRGLNDGILFNSATSETDDFNAFDSTAETARPKKAPQKTPKSPKKKASFDLNLKTILIAAASLVVFILLIVIIVAIVNSNSKNITAENNTYVSYESNGLYYLAMNGSTVGTEFENEISVTPAADNSFAYVLENTADGYNVFILQKKELMQIVPNPVTEIIALAEYKPGVIYKENEQIYFYADENEERLTKDPTAGNFVISPDASAVAYTRAKEDNVNEFKLYLYVDGMTTDYASNMYPVAVSNGGKYLYSYGIMDDYVSKKLYVIIPEDDDKKEIASAFNSLTYMNIKGDEIVYSIGSAEAGYRSYIYSIKKDESFKIGAGICKPLIADPSVVALSSLKEVFMENTFVTDTSSSATYYVDKKYSSDTISKFNGQLNQDENMFFYINSDDTLYYIDLDDKNRTPNRLTSDVQSFIVTAKDNVYCLDTENTLKFCKTSTRKTRTVANDVVAMSMNDYSNILYFQILDDVKVYSTEEGPGKEIAEFGRSEVQTPPVFIDGGQKRSFACVQDSATSLYDIYYTSTGKTYKLVAEDCSSINGWEDFGSDIETGANNTTSNNTNNNSNTNAPSSNGASG
ncbi:MAG: hypothetical protein IJ038_02095 [Clostridia bacterium]|nr:hypothetical protein [Clostridia bacterium]